MQDLFRFSRWRAPLMVLLVVVAGLLMTAGSVLAVGNEPTYGTATVDGNTGEWNLTNDFFATMWRAADSTKPNPVMESNLYLRYDCDAQRLYVLVLSLNGQNVLLQPDDAFVKLGNPIKLIDGTLDGIATNKQFSWVNSNGSRADGFEAGFDFAPGSYSNLNVHVQVDNGGAQTSAVDGRAIPLDISCPDEPETGSITIFKQVVRGDQSQLFGFSLTGDTVSETVDLSDSSEGHAGDFLDLPVGEYTITEDLPLLDGWSYLTAYCSENSDPFLSFFQQITYTAVDNGLSFNLAADKHIYCFFFNDYQAPPTGTLRVVKQVPESQAATAPNFDFSSSLFSPDPQSLSIGANGFGATGQYEVAPGEYSVEEVNIPNGWYLVSIDCGDAPFTLEGDSGVNVTVGAGEDVICTFFNERRGNITIEKDVTVGDEDQVFDFMFEDFNFPLSETGGEDGLFDALVPDNYTITEENLPEGWTLDNVVCESTGDNSSFSDVEGGVTVSLASGEDVTCTFNNTYTPPTTGALTITKDAQPDSDQVFEFTGSIGILELVDDGIDNGLLNSQQYEIDAGNQVVYETAVEGWNLTGVTCTGTDTYSVDLETGQLSVTIPAGGNVNCTFVNVQEPPHEDLCEMNPDSILVNGCFEEPVVSGGNWNIYDNVPGWDITWLDNEPCPVTNIDPSLELQTEATLGDVDVINGDQYAELDTDCDGPSSDSNPERTTVEISQTLTTIPGHRYEVSFYFNARPNHISQNLRVTIDGVEKFSEAAPSDWSLRTFEFVATSTETVIAFADTGDPNSYGVLIDCINVLDLGEEPRGSIRVTKFNDLNENGVRNNGEDRLPGWTFNVYAGSEAVGDPIRSNITNSNGRRTFGNLLPGTYTVCEVMQAGWTNVTPLCRTTVVVSGERAELGFGNIELPPVTETCNASEVVSFNQGLDRNFNPIVGARSNPNQALGEPQDNDTINFVSLGFGGELILRLNGLVVDNNGSDFDLYFVETTFGNETPASYPESAEIYIGLNPAGPWTPLGTVTLDGGFDFPGDGASALYVRLVDVSNRGSFSSSVADGYDLDGIRCSEPNIPPVAEDDHKLVWYGQLVCLDVMANDFDGDGDMLSLLSNTAAGEGTATINNTDYVHDYLCYEHDRDNSPAPGGTETDQFDYTVTDGQDNASATVYIDVARLAVVCESMTDTEITWQVTNPAVQIDFIWNLYGDSDSDGGFSTATVGASSFVTPRLAGTNEVVIMVGSLNGNTEQDNATSEGCEEEPVDVTLVKTIDWNGNDVNNAVNFELCIDNLCDIADYDNGYTVVIPNVAVGSHTLSETPAANWTTSFPGGTNANVTVGGENTFYIHNTADAPPPPPAEQVGTIRVTKNVVTPPAQYGDFTICIANAVFPEDQQNQANCYTVHNDGDQIWWNVVIPEGEQSASYVISENNPGANWSVDGSGVSVTVYPDQTSYHTITNTYNTPPPPSCNGGMGQQSDLSGIITISGSTAFGTVYNNSNVEDCQYQIGMASYSKYDDIIDNQILFAGFDTIVTIPAGGSVQISIALPECSAQVDLFYGSFLPDLNGQRYGSRLLAAVHNNIGYCQAQVVNPPQQDPPQQEIVIEEQQPPEEGGAGE